MHITSIGKRNPDRFLEGNGRRRRDGVRPLCTGLEREEQEQNQMQDNPWMAHENRILGTHREAKREFNRKALGGGWDASALR